jgi:hypothetical protein
MMFVLSDRTIAVVFRAIFYSKSLLVDIVTFLRLNGDS